MNYFADTAKDVGGGELFHSNDESEDDVDFFQGDCSTWYTVSI